jgi:hypothetical protein
MVAQMVYFYINQGKSYGILKNRFFSFSINVSNFARFAFLLIKAIQVNLTYLQII